MYLQSYILPIVLYSLENGVASLREVMGTSFLIGKRGIFLTAGHVLKSAEANAEKKGFSFGLVVKTDNGKGAGSCIAKPIGIEYAAAPFDVAVGQIPYTFQSPLTLEKREVSVWQEVATLGYPLNAVNGDLSDFRINLRAHRGYVQRILAPGEIKIGTHPAGYEVNFLVDKGISGGPLFVRSESHDIVIGVCIGSERSELIEDERLEIMENGSTYKEVKLKIEQYGVAHDITGLHEWKPNLLNGKTLWEEAP